MTTITSKKQLAIALSKLKDFEKQDIKLEQYSTPSEIVADWLWNAYNLGDIEGKIILDAACGPGYLGLGALLLGAKRVYFVDISKEALDIAQINISSLKLEEKSECKLMDITEFSTPVDVVLQNPPFGTKIKHHDKLFLEQAFSVSNIVYSMHKLNTGKFVEAITKDHSFTITHLWAYNFPIKHSQKWHRKPVRNVEVGVWRMKKE